MEKQNEPLETLSEIRSMMERSSRFISLNGLSGVFAGVFALVGAYAANRALNLSYSDINYWKYSEPVQSDNFFSLYFFFFTDAFLVLVASISVALFLSVRKAQKKGIKIWDNTAKRMIINMMIPLVSGGLFCIILLYHGLVGLVAPVTLIFYGLALINTSKYTYNDIRYLGLIELALGLLSSIWIGYGLYFWALGFGVSHIVYGIIMYYKYER